MPSYKVDLVASFSVKSDSPSALRERLVSLISSKGFSERDFELSIVREADKIIEKEKKSNVVNKKAVSKKGRA